MDDLTIARVCHEANRAWCIENGDEKQPMWESAPGWQIRSAVDGVRFHRLNPEAEDSDSHVEWMAEKVRAGWVYGHVKDVEAKIHPCLLPFDQLPEVDQKKDALFRAIVHALK